MKGEKNVLTAHFFPSSGSSAIMPLPLAAFLVACDHAFSLYMRPKSRGFVEGHRAGLRDSFLTCLNTAPLIDNLWQREKWKPGVPAPSPALSPTSRALPMARLCFAIATALTKLRVWVSSLPIHSCCHQNNLRKVRLCPTLTPWWLQR